ncbi:MAG: hypothetical protein IKM79_04215 [Bacteroidales bacterium]|nr:hypothetical protein [Bacteroidales bacterium]
MKKNIALLLGFTLLTLSTMAQEKEKADTLECHIIGFSTGLLIPGSGSASEGTLGSNMKDLYAAPYLDFSIECDYKYKSGWMMTLDGDLWFGLNSNNLQQREVRLGSVYTSLGQALAFNGTDGNVAAHNRSLAARLGVAKIIPVIPENPNSGIMLKFSGGWLMQKTVFTQDMNESAVPQLRGRYAKLYDHLRNGAVLTQSVGFCYMSNYLTYINFKVELSVSESLMWSSRPYVIDNVAGLNGKDNNRYFDMFYGLKLTWLFPLMGKTTYDYYYY